MLIRSNQPKVHGHDLEFGISQWKPNLPFTSKPSPKGFLMPGRSCVDTVMLPAFRGSLLGCPGPTTNALHRGGYRDVVPTHQI